MIRAQSVPVGLRPPRVKGGHDDNNDGRVHTQAHEHEHTSEYTSEYMSTSSNTSTRASIRAHKHEHEHEHEHEHKTQAHDGTWAALAHDEGTKDTRSWA